ncbi:ribosome biogenesis GTPase Der [Kistimonas asteriae]|uniref:ribosome biogenesis GTPase Der n=1 Tax=Kistimonas asteriae TaxID=517724 RepID=UPI001BA93864|nr:ribosome biogenesis GTPase Der [Kistimonas asteriae]
MLPVIALVGRPNVGKSTLFNRLTRSRDAIVADYEGLTRDRKYGEGRQGDRAYIVIDTGGISGDEEGIDAAMASQSLAAIDEADAVFFIVDARAGLTSADEMIADHLRRQGKSAWLVMNKVDTVDPDSAASEFYGLGLGDPRPIAAAHGRGVRTLIEEALHEFPDSKVVEEDVDSEKGIKMAVVGRPNVGKSTLVNRMLGEDRVVVYDQAGTTRDSVYIPYERFEKRYTLIDTAGVRRRGRVSEGVEKFSVIKTLQAMEDANVVILVLDAREGIVDQDLHLLGFVLDSGRALVIALNKWDGMTQDERQQVKTELERRLSFINFARIHFISAKHGTGVGHLYESVEEAYEAATSRWSTNQLTRTLEDAVASHQPPLVRGHRIKLRYCHLGGTNPPTLVIHGNQTGDVPLSYRRYLENTYRRVLNIMGTPVRIEFKTSENPFAGRKNKLNERQIKKKQRLVQHIKKIEKKKKKKR